MFFHLILISLHPLSHDWGYMPSIVMLHTGLTSIIPIYVYFFSLPICICAIVDQ